MKKLIFGTIALALFLASCDSDSNSTAANNASLLRTRVALNGSWQTILEGNSACSSLTSFNGVPYVFIKDDNGKATVKTLTNGTWQVLGQESFSNYEISCGSKYIKTDALGNLYVAYLNVLDSENTNFSISVKKYANNTWQNVGPAEVIQVSGWFDFTVSTTGVPYITYSHKLTGNGYVMKYTNGLWLNISYLSFSVGDASDFSTAVIGETVYVKFTDIESYGVWIPGQPEPIVPPRVVDKFKKFTNGYWLTAAIMPELYMNVKFATDGGFLYSIDGIVNNRGMTIRKYIASQLIVIGGEEFANGYSYAFTVKDGVIYVAYTDRLDGLKLKVKRFDGSTWSELGSTPAEISNHDSWLESISVSGNSVYVSFHQYNNGVVANYLLKYN